MPGVAGLNPGGWSCGGTEAVAHRRYGAFAPCWDLKNVEYREANLKDGVPYARRGYFKSGRLRFFSM